MTTKKFILDASVAAKWFLDDEDLVDVAEKYLERLLANEIELHAPLILQYELGHSLLKAQRKDGRTIDAAKCLEAYEAFSQLPIIFHNLDEKARFEALDFAIKYRRGYYDSAYIWLAQSLGCEWLTSEKRYGANLPAGFPLNAILTLESQD